jgi:CRP-like cAMP-binding protein
VSASNRSGLSRYLTRLLHRSNLNDEEQRAVLGLSSVTHQVRPNHDIVTPGDAVEHSCLIAHGLAARYDPMSDGQRQINLIYIPGDMSDLHSVVWPTAQWGIVALATTTVLHVPHRELRQLADRYPALALAFWRDCTVDASILAKWTGCLGRRKARSRFAHLLCEMAVRMEDVGLGTRESFVFEMTQSQLGDALGLTAVHVNRILQAFRAEHVIQTQRPIVSVLDWDRLVHIAEFDPGYLLRRA